MDYGRSIDCRSGGVSMGQLEGAVVSAWAERVMSFDLLAFFMIDALIINFMLPQV